MTAVISTWVICFVSYFTFLNMVKKGNLDSEKSYALGWYTTILTIAALELLDLVSL